MHSDQWLLVFFSFLITIILIKKTLILQAIYILFHEISHAIAALISKGEIHEIKISSDFGYVKSDKNNLIIRLAPYLLPLLPILTILLICTIKFIMKVYFSKIEPFLLDKVFLAMISALLFSTTYYNFYLLKSETTDIDPKQVLFSLVLIANTYTLSVSLTIAAYFALNKFIQNLHLVINVH